MENRFTHLHVHSDYSLLTGLAKIKDIVDKAKKDGMTSIALTDLGNLYGAIDFYKTCVNAGIKPIIGVEMYLAPNGMLNKRAKLDEEINSIVLLAKNNVGYKNLLKLVSISYLEGFYYKPRVDFEILKYYSEGLIALSSGITGEISKSILKNYDDDKFDNILKKYTDIFGKENFYIEILRYPNKPEQEVVNQKLIKAAQRNNVQIVAAANSYYLNTEDSDAHDILLCIQNNRKVYEDNRFKMTDEDYSFLPTNEMLKRFSDIPQAIDNTNKIAEECNLKIEFGIHKLPSYEIPEGYTYETYLKELCYKGLEYRYGGKVDNNYNWNISDADVLIEYQGIFYYKKDILERLEYELSVIEKTGFASYFLIVSDFIIWSKNNGIMVGPGRGSAAGSMVAYLTQIVALDPLKYDLLFERFLNPERISMPDIDTDFADTRREDVIRYTQEKYGHDKVSGIITFGTLGARAVVRDVGRALGVEYAYCDKLSKMIPMFTDLITALDEVSELKTEYKNNEDCKSIIGHALKLEGVKRHASQHACGILITKDPLTDYVPVQKVNSEDENIVSQYSLFPVEDLGLLKMDFLGLKNLTVLENTLEKIKVIYDENIDLEKINMDDKKVYELLQRGETTGIFQFESTGMKKYLKDLKPTELEDLIAMGALYRPGPLDAGMVDEYIARKNGKKEVIYSHEMLEPILRSTYGVIVYQEQVMRIARDMAGFTLSEADVLRKAVGKKIKALMDKQRNLLLAGMENKGVSKKIAQDIWSQIETFARYGFNRSHAACYGVISYYTAYMKSKYPVEYMASLLTADLKDIDRISVEINECKQMGIDVNLPDINESFSRFTVVAESLKEGRPRIRFGLMAIKGVGENIAKIIIKERKENGQFQDFTDFLLRVHSRDLNKKSLDSLIRSGAFDRFGDRNEFIMNMEKILSFVKENHSKETGHQNSLFGLMENLSKPNLILDKYPCAPKQVQLSWEKELLGFYLSEHPFEEFQNELNGYIVDTYTLNTTKLKGHVRVGGLVSSVKKIITKKGDIMLFVNIEDTKGVVEVIVFPSVYSATYNLWEENNIVIISGNMSDKEDGAKIICNEVKLIDLKILNKLKVGMSKLNIQIADEAKNLFLFFKKVIGAETVQLITEILQGNNGSNKVYLAVPLDQQKYRKIETNFTVDLSNTELIEKLNLVSDLKFIKIM